MLSDEEIVVFQELLWGANGWLLCRYEVLGTRYQVVGFWIKAPEQVRGDSW